jgi:hypothetical protein
MLDRAKFLVVSEISEVMGVKTPLIDERVDQALERCFSTKAKNTARSVAAKATRAKNSAAEDEEDLTPARPAPAVARAAVATAPRRTARAS